MNSGMAMAMSVLQRALPRPGTMQSCAELRSKPYSDYGRNIVGIIGLIGDVDDRFH